MDYIIINTHVNIVLAKWLQKVIITNDFIKIVFKFIF